MNPPFKLTRSNLFWRRCNKCSGWFIAHKEGVRGACGDCYYEGGSVRFCGGSGDAPTNREQLELELVSLGFKNPLACCDERRGRIG